MEIKQNSEPGTIRPALLSALCILTFIGSSVGFMGYFLAALFFEDSAHIIITYSSWHTTDLISPYYFTLLMAFFAISLTGAIRMWKLHRNGFFIYSISQLAILFIPVIWINWNALSTTNAVFTFVFIGGYSLMYKHLS